MCIRDRSNAHNIKNCVERHCVLHDNAYPHTAVTERLRPSINQSLCIVPLYCTTSLPPSDYNSIWSTHCGNKRPLIHLGPKNEGSGDCVVHCLAEKCTGFLALGFFLRA